MIFASFFKIAEGKKVNRVSKIPAYMYESGISAGGIFVSFYLVTKEGNK